MANFETEGSFNGAKTSFLENACLHNVLWDYNVRRVSLVANRCMHLFIALDSYQYT